MNNDDLKPQTSSDESIITNPFDSPEMSRLSSRVCSPEIFDITDEKTDDFEWSISELSILKPAEINTESFQENTSFDPEREHEIQERISNFFRQSTLIRSPQRRTGAKEQSINLRLKCQEEDRDDQEYIFNNSDQKRQYLPEEDYEKKLFSFEYCSPCTPERLTPVDSPLQLSPVKNLNFKGLCDEIERETLKLCSLSPILKRRLSEDLRGKEMPDENKSKKVKKGWKAKTKAFFNGLF